MTKLLLSRLHLSTLLKSGFVQMLIISFLVATGNASTLTGQAVGEISLAANEREVTDTPTDLSVSGTVTDENGASLPGVNVVVKGTSLGTTTDASGRFSIMVPDESSVLVFTFIGYTRREITVGNQGVINVSLEPDVTALEEVVVVGYGVQKKVNLTGAVSSVDFDNTALNSRALTNVSSMLSGMAAGLNVRQSNGLPSDNNESTISIRGRGSLNNSSDPLVIVDGQAAPIGSVNPNDVASVSVLKDAASAAIYGSRASNGVILITTKSGKNADGRVTFNYDGYVGLKSPTMVSDLISNTADHMTIINAARVNSGLPAGYTDAQIQEWREGSKTDPIKYPNTDWWDGLIKKNVVHSHNISARGGNEKINFYTSFNHFKDDGMVANTDFTRLSFRNNLSYKVNDWLRLGNNLNYMSTKAGPAEIADMFRWFRALTPGMVPKHPDGRYGGAQTPALETGDNNPLKAAETQRGETEGGRIQGKLFAELTPLKGLKVTASVFLDRYERFGWNGSQPTNLWNFQDNTIADENEGQLLILRNNYQKSQSTIYDLYVDYQKSLNAHNFSVLAGFNQQYFINSNLNVARQGLLSYETPVMNAASGEINNLGGGSNDWAMRSFFGRLTYDYKGKYLFETNLRYDGSSRFAPDERWGVFPSVSVGWILSEEAFWSPLSETINAFKVRGSWGALGNNGIGNYEWQSFYVSANYPFNESVVSGLRYNAFGNPLITWETTNVMNLGVDMLLFRNLELSANYYDKLTNNILINTPIPDVNGGIKAPRVNAAEVRNSGVEVEARYVADLGKVHVSLGANFSYNRNKIEKYHGDFIESHGVAGAWTEGYPIGVFWVRDVDHIVQDQSEIDALVADGYTFKPSTPGRGDFLYRDANGDKVINDDDRVLMGNPIPLYNYGFNAGLNYGGFDLNVFVDGVGGWDKYLNSAIYKLNHIAGGYLWPVEYMNMWTEENPSTKIPRIYSDNAKNDQVSSFYLNSAAYLKIRSVQLGYTLPADLTREVNLESVRLYVNLENYFTFTNWPAMDPEAARTADDDTTYPLARTLSMGLSLKF